VRVVRVACDVKNVKSIDTLKTAANVRLEAVNLLEDEAEQVPGGRNSPCRTSFGVLVLLGVGSNAIDEFTEGVVESLEISRCSEQILEPHVYLKFLVDTRGHARHANKPPATLVLSSAAVIPHKSMGEQGKRQHVVADDDPDGRVVKVRVRFLPCASCLSVR